MAKRNNDAAFAVDRAKVRVFFAELEGNNQSVQEALKTMVSAMSRPVRIISEQNTGGKAALFLQTDDDAEIEDTVEVVDEVQSEQNTSQSSRKPRGTGRKIDRNSGLRLVPDLNFRPDEKQSWKDFFAEKAPSKDIETVLAAVYYMQHVMKLEKIGPSHIMTAFKEAGTSIPVDLRQTIRNAKNAKVWLKFTDIEDIRTTTQGENFIEHELGGSE